MREFRILSVVAVATGLLIAMSSQIAAAQQYKKITRIGTSQSVCPGGIQTAEQLQNFFANNPGAVRQILADSGWTGSADALIAAVANGEMIERSYPVGTQLKWMGAKKNGNYLALPYREWAGAKSFEAFQVNLSTDCRNYHIAIPKACCNVSLISVEPDTSSACVEPEPVVQPVAVAPEPKVEPAAKAALGLIPFFGAFVGSETRPRFEISWQEDQRDSSGIIGVRAGLLKELNAKTSLFGQVSYYDRQGINEGNVFSEDNFAIDVGVDYKLTRRAFIGGGIGVWDVDDSDFSEASLFGHVGGDIGKSNFQWIIEGRVFDSDSETLDSISNNRALNIGVRYLVR